jgi:hypothetical protein
MITAEYPTVTPPLAPPPVAPPPVAIEPPHSVPRILLGLILVVAAFDVCFWGASGMGLSVAVFIPLLAGAILMNRENPWRRSTVAILALLAGACFATMIETGTTNTLALLVLVLALAGDSYYNPADPAWTRWYSQCLALAFAPGRIFWLAARLAQAFFGHATGAGSRVVSGVLLTIPALVLALVFGALLASGNAVFGTWTGNFFNWLGTAIANLFDFWRVVMWGFVAFIALPLLRPAPFASYWWRWIPSLPRWPELIANNGAIFSSALVLVVLNLIFGVANIADALFLWSGAALPAGEEYKAYVHEGFDTLIFTVILTAFVLTVMFQQSLGVARSATLKVLALLWIAQNVFLIASCALRIRGYVDESQLTILRLSCLIFLALVAAGFAVLTVKILHERSIAWLIGRCCIAVFVTFYITQFLDLGGYAENYNAARLARDPGYHVDTWKLYEAGPAGWPAARRAHELDASIAVLNGTGDAATTNDKGPETGATVNLAKFDAKHWREFSLRAYWNRWALEEK